MKSLYISSDRIGRYWSRFIMYFLLLLPEGFYTVNSKVCSCISIVVSLLIILVHLSKLQKVYQKRSCLFVFTYLLWPFALTLVRYRSVNTELLRNFLILNSFFAIWYCSWKEKKDVIFDVRVLRDYFTATIACNIIHQLVFPYGFNVILTGLQRYYLMGNANSFIFAFVIALMLSAFYSTATRNKMGIHTLILCIMEVIAYFLCIGSTSTTGILCVVAYTGFIILLQFDFIRQAMISSVKRFRVILIIVAFIFVFLVTTDYVSDFLVLIGMNESDIMNFQSRMYLWNNALQKIKKSLIFGNGVLDGNFVVSLTGRMRSAHNNYLQILYYSGLLGLIIYFVAIFKTIGELKRKKILNNDMYAVYSASILIVLIGYFVEQNPFSIYFLVLLCFGISLQNAYVS